MPVRVVVILIFILYIIILMFKNNFSVKVDLLFKSFNIPFLAIVIISIFLGIFISLIVCVKSLNRQRDQIKQLKARLNGK